MSVRQRYERIVRESYEKHVVTEHTMTRLVFREPGTNNCYIRYDIVGPRTLVVTGDLGCAVYQWSSEIGFAWLGGLSLDYFVGKCQASEEGRDFKTWDNEAAKERFEQLRANLEEDQRKELDAFLEENGPEFRGALENRHEWNLFADANLRTFWEDMDGMFDIGMTTALRAVYHLEGLRMAMALVRAAESSPA